MPAFACLLFTRYRSIVLALAHTSRITTMCCMLHKTHLLSHTTHYRKGYSPTCTPQSHLSSSVLYILIIFIDIDTASISTCKTDLQKSVISQWWVPDWAEAVRYD